MPKYPKEDDAARAARSALAAANLIKAAGYEAVEEPILYPPPLCYGHSVPAAGLVIITADKYYREGIVRALQEVRTDVLMVAAGATTSGAWATYFTLLLCRSGEIVGYGPLLLWAGAGERLHLVPDPAGCDPATPSFRLDPLRLVPIPAPSPDFLGRKGGLARAELLLRGELPEGL
jgi:hypothetical protein